jgi:hypothetical protein
MIRTATRCAAFALIFAAFNACPLSAQSPQRSSRVRNLGPAPAEQPPIRERQVRADDENARDTRQRFQEILRQYPPSLGEVLRYDPSLLTNEAYLTPYPSLAAFLAQHPEVAHNPGYFVGEYRDNQWQNDPRRPVLQLMEGVLAGLAVLTGFVTLVGVVGWLLKSLIDYRRWLRLSKIQTEAHSKLLDRLTSNEDLLAYMQSSPGRRFLESAPIPVDPATRPIAAPVGRILWSVQAGMVVAMGGLGLLYVSSRMASGAPGFTPGYAELSIPLFVMGIVAVALGGGFVLSAGVAYAISRRLGLFDTAPLTPHA